MKKVKLTALFMSAVLILSSLSGTGVWAAQSEETDAVVYEAAIQETVSASEVSEASEDAVVSVAADGGIFRPVFEPVSAEYAAANEYVPAEDDLSVGNEKYLTDYDVYSSNFYYNQLNSEERAYWDALDEMCAELMDSSDDLDVTYSNSYSYGITKAIAAPETFSVLPMTGSSGAIGKIVALNYLYMYSHPQYYFLLSSGASTDGKYGVFYTYGEFAKGADRQAGAKKLFEGIDEFKKEIDKNIDEPTVTGSKDYVTLKAIHDAIITNIKYNHAEGDKIDGGTMYYDSMFTQSAYSAAVYKNTVCAGFTKLTELLCSYYGIECTGVTSTGHAWNHVIVDDDMYLIDNTWDENFYEKDEVPYYRFFLKKYNEDGRHTPEGYYSNFKLKTTKTTELVENGTVAVAPEIASEKCAEPVISVTGSGVTISSATEDADIYYTVDGKEPSRARTKSILYKNGVDQYGDIKAIAVKEGYLNSDAIEERVGYSITYVLNGGENAKENPNGYLGTETDTILLTDATRSGYSFGGWYTDEGFTSSIVEIDPSLKQDITVYAKWVIGETKPEDSKGAYNERQVIQKPGFRNFLSKIGTDGSTTFRAATWNCYGYIYENGIFKSYNFAIFLAYTDGYKYQGKAIKPYVYAYDMTTGVEMEPGKHYSVGYKNNKDVSSPGKIANIIIRGKGQKYKGVRMDKDKSTKGGNFFTINPISLNDENITLVEVAVPYKKGKPQTKKKPLVYLNGVKLGNKDYSLEYPGAIAVTPTNGKLDPEAGKPAANPYGDVGKYIVTVKAGTSGNLKDSRNTMMIVADGAIISKAKVKYNKKYVYTGSPIKPEVTVSIKNVMLVPDKDYIVTYAGNTDKGKGLIIIKGIGQYAGTTVKNFTIK